MRVYVMLCKRGPIVVFIADSKRSRLAEKECHLSLLEQIKIRKLTKCGHLEDKTLAVVSLILSLL
jgi:hypothetical protein